MIIDELAIYFYAKAFIMSLLINDWGDDGMTLNIQNKHSI